MSCMFTKSLTDYGSNETKRDMNVLLIFGYFIHSGDYELVRSKTKFSYQ